MKKKNRKKVGESDSERTRERDREEDRRKDREGVDRNRDNKESGGANKNTKK